MVTHLRPQILVVDDEPFSRTIVTRLLGAISGADILSAATADQAFALLRQHGSRIELVISDFVMAEITGLHILQRIRTGAAGVPHTLPVAMLTGHADHGLVGAAMALDVDVFLVKPVSKSVLAARLAKADEEKRDYKSAAAYGTVDIDTVCRAFGAHAESPPAGDDETPPPAAAEGPPRLPLEEIPEGATLLEDLRGSQGDLLLAAGAPLTARDLRRLRELKSVTGIAALAVAPPAGA
jgi:CheY-like chemotaxis protein